MGGKPRARGNGNGRTIMKQDWRPPPQVKRTKVGSIHHCGTAGVYIGMMRLAPGGDIWQVAFRCDDCARHGLVSQWSEKISWEDAEKIRIQAYALQGIQLCTTCGDPLLDKKGKPHQHDDAKEAET